MVDGEAMSSQPCGCDPEENYQCEHHTRTNPSGIINLPSVFMQPLRPGRGLPVMDSERKALPIFMGVLMYFPDALLEVARVSQLGNDQHNPGEPLHWAREKSTDQMNTALRHMMDHALGNVKDDGGKTYHLAKAAWRNLAELQLTIEKERT